MSSLGVTWLLSLSRTTASSGGRDPQHRPSGDYHGRRGGHHLWPGLVPIRRHRGLSTAGLHRRGVQEVRTPGWGPGMRGLLKYSNKRGSEFCSPITKLPLSKWNVLFGLRTFQETTWRKFHFIMVTPPIHYKMDRFQKMSFWRNLHSLILLLLMIVYFQTNFRFLSDLLPAARELDA